MKAIYPLTANPWHYGHQYVYDAACEMFDGSVVVAIACNQNKSVADAKFLQWTINPIVKNSVIVDGALADYCSENDIRVVVRGARTGYDLDYEIGYASWNQEIDDKLRFAIVPSPQRYGHVSSTAIRELNGLGKIQEVCRYMDPMVYYRWARSTDDNEASLIPKKAIFFGQSCTGKSTWIQNYSKAFSHRICHVDTEIWNFVEKDGEYCKSLVKSFRESFLQAIDSQDHYWFVNLVHELGQTVNWEGLFGGMWDSYDFPVLGNYWEYIPSKLLAGFRIVKLYAQPVLRDSFMRAREKERGLLPGALIKRVEFLDSIYEDAPFQDEYVIRKTECYGCQGKGKLIPFCPQKMRKFKLRGFPVCPDCGGEQFSER